MVENGSMKSSFHRVNEFSSLAQHVRGRLHVSLASVVLLLGAAALVGWLLAEFYVAAVTTD